MRHTRRRSRRRRRCRRTHDNFCHPPPFYPPPPPPLFHFARVAFRLFVRLLGLVVHAVSSDLKKRMDGYVFGIVSIREIAQQPKLENPFQVSSFFRDSLFARRMETHTHTVSEREDMCE